MNRAFHAHFFQERDGRDEPRKGHRRAMAAVQEGNRFGTLARHHPPYLSGQCRDHPDSGCPSALLPEISRQEPVTRHVCSESVKRLLNAVEKQLPDMPKRPKAREIAFVTLGPLIGTLQIAPAVDDPSLSEDILAAGTHVASTLIQPAKRRT